MSVRRITRRDPETGAAKTFLMADVTVRLPDGTRVRDRKVPRIQTVRAARECELELRNELLARHATKKEEKRTVTLAEFAEDFVRTYADTNNKSSEVDSKRTILRKHLLPAFGGLDLRAIDTKRVEAFKAEKLRGGMSAKTVNNCLSVLRKALVVAQEWDYDVPALPRIKRLPVAEPEFDFFDLDEAQRFLQAAKAEPEWGRFFEVAVHTGLRRGELLALRWKDVDLATEKLLVRQSVTRGVIGTPKSGKPREIPLCRRAIEALRAQRHQRGELVFCRPDGTMLKDEDERAPLHRACRRAGLRKVRIHTLRHTFATHLTMHGATTREVQELLGHSDIRVTQRYSHLAPSVRRRAIELFDAQPPRGNFGAIPFEAR